MVVRARNERVRKMRDKTIDVLLQMGVPASIKGFTYICDAIELFDTDPYYPDGKICSLYFEIARLHETTASRVERAIRHAFEVALTKGERDIVELYLDCEHTQNSNLLKTLYFRMQQEEHKREKDSICSSSTCEMKAQIYQEGIIDCTFVSESAYSITERTGKEINRICHIQSCWMPDTEEEIREQFIKSGKKRMIPFV